MKKIIPFVICLVCIGNQIMIKNVHAHYIQTHQYIINLATEILIRDNDSIRSGKNTLYVEFLKTSIEEKGIPKTYIRKLMEGVRDADRIGNGLYKFNGYWNGSEADGWLWKDKIWNDRWDWDENHGTTEENFEFTVDINDFAHWPIGDHGYKAATGTEPARGFYSLRNLDDYMAKIKIENPTEFAEVLTAIKVIYFSYDPETDEPNSLNDDAEIKFKSILQTSNAADMAEHFYQIAIEKWNSNNRIAAMYNLGIALHAIQDLTVPHHTRLLPNDEIYERPIWQNILQAGQKAYDDFFIDDPFVGLYSVKSAKEWAIENANITSDPEKISLDESISGLEVVKLAARSSVGAIFSFFQDVNYTGPAASSYVHYPKPILHHKAPSLN